MKGVLKIGAMFLLYALMGVFGGYSHHFIVDQPTIRHLTAERDSLKNAKVELMADLRAVTRFRGNPYLVGDSLLYIFWDYGVPETTLRDSFIAPGYYKTIVTVKCPRCGETTENNKKCDFCGAYVNYRIPPTRRKK